MRMRVLIQTIASFPLLSTSFFVARSIPTLAFAQSACSTNKSSTTSRASSLSSCPSSSSSFKMYNGAQSTNPSIHTHYIFLVHGWLGNSLEMSYLHTALNKTMLDWTQLQDYQHDTDSDTVENDNKRVVVHSAIANEGQTTDGIIAGGTRLATEVQQFITSDLLSQEHLEYEQLLSSTTSSDDEDERSDDGNDHKGLINVSISFVGNSLGGLYSRYAISSLPSEFLFSTPAKNVDDNKSNTDIERKIGIYFNTFVTTATPHLGCKSQTFLPLPRIAEKVIGSTLSTTGKDLFRLDTDDLIYQMSTDYDRFLLPLSSFRKRLCYANAFSTDFQVPTCTAGFLDGQSHFPHTILNHSDGTSIKENKESFVVASFETKRDEDMMIQGGREMMKQKMKNTQDEQDEHYRLLMSNKLDSLGWEKVFIDVRNEIPTPGLTIPPWFVKNKRGAWKEFIDSADSSSGDGRQVSSQDLVRFMTGSDQIQFPLGHTVMVANSKSEFYANLNSGGRPVMDKLAKELIQYIIEE